MKILNILTLTLAIVGLGASQLAAVTVETVVGGLDNPCGVAIQPGTGDVFVSDSGANRVIRVVDGKAQDVIVGFPTDVYGKGPKYNIGPLGLAFLNENTLVVGGGGFTDDKELLRIYDVPAAGSPPIKAGDMSASFTLEANDELAAEGNYYGIAATSDAIYVTCNGDDTKGWVSKADVKDGKVSNFRRFIATKEAVELDAPVAIAVDPDTGRVVVGQMGEITVPEDGMITLYDAETGELSENHEGLGLHDITGIARNPVTAMWYATDFAWFDTSKGALYQLLPEVTELTKLDKPSALAFSDDGKLYVTVIGSGEKGGKLLQVSGL